MTDNTSETEWQDIAFAPRDGQRIQVKHELATNDYDVTAVWDGKNWACSEFFLDSETFFLYKRPTHWKPL